MFSPVSLGRISEVIVDQIRSLIRGGELVPGSRLPSERDLCTQFGVSRVTVREALRVLESSGLIEIRVGARGGAFVTSPTSERVGVGITDLLAMSALTPAEVTEARQLFELGIVPIVCKRATAEDIEDLLAMCAVADAALKRGEYTMELSTDFHVRLAEATHNAAIRMLVQSLREPMLMSLQRAHDAAPVMGRKGAREHRAFVQAVRDRDPVRAQEIMTDHLGRTAARVASLRA
jgi:GntR family transcriptional regulator, transcriptional repressor for pyruvate dehydrogenase complex